jgi:ferredoxin
MKLKITVNPELCFGAAACVTVSPSHFRLNDKNKAEVLENNEDIAAGQPVYERIIDADEAKKDELLLAARSCPVAAISIFDVETGERLYPKD